MDNVNVGTVNVELSIEERYRRKFEKHIRYSKKMSELIDVALSNEDAISVEDELDICRNCLAMYKDYYRILFNLLSNKAGVNDVLVGLEGKIENLLYYLSAIVTKISIAGGNICPDIVRNDAVSVNNISDIEGKLDAGLEQMVGNAIENTVQSKIMPNLETITEMLLDLQNGTPGEYTGELDYIVNKVLNSRLSLNGATVAEQVEKYAAFTANTEKVKSGEFTPALKLTKQGIKEKRTELGRESGKGLSVGNVGVAKELGVTAAGVDNFIDKCILDVYSKVGDVDTVAIVITDDLYISSEEVIRRLKKMTDKIAELKARGTGSKEIAKKLNVSRRLIDKIIS
jgi:hypothetical protein